MLPLPLNRDGWSLPDEVAAPLLGLIVACPLLSGGGSGGGLPFARAVMYGPQRSRAKIRERAVLNVKVSSNSIILDAKVVWEVDFAVAKMPC